MQQFFMISHEHSELFPGKLQTVGQLHAQNLPKSCWGLLSNSAEGEKPWNAVDAFFMHHEDTQNPWRILSPPKMSFSVSKNTNG